MGKIISHKEFENARGLLSAARTKEDVERIAEVTGLSARTIQRIKSADSYRAYRLLLLGEQYRRQQQRRRQSQINRYGGPVNIEDKQVFTIKNDRAFTEPRGLSLADIAKALRQTGIISCEVRTEHTPVGHNPFYDLAQPDSYYDYAKKRIVLVILFVFSVLAGFFCGAIL